MLALFFRRYCKEATKFANEYSSTRQKVCGSSKSFQCNKPVDVCDSLTILQEATPSTSSSLLSDGGECWNVRGLKIDAIVETRLL